MMVRTMMLSALLIFSAAPVFACKNAMKKDAPPARTAPKDEAPVTAQKTAPTEQREGETLVQRQEPATPNFALLGLAGVGLAGLTGAFVLRSKGATVRS